MGRRTRVPTQKAIEFAAVTGQQRKKEGATKIPLINLGKEENGGKFGGNEKKASMDTPTGKSVADSVVSSMVLQSTKSHDCAVQKGENVRSPTSPSDMQPVNMVGNSLRTTMQSPNR
ncbi:hypothetical protein HAX54_013391, partial [Datura stramonium]|nr:hypothetical protein [Datura stramonium]